MAESELPTFAQWLTVSMDNKGWSGRKLAKELGYHDTSVSKWKAGEAVPSVATLVKIAKVFGVPPPRLLATARPEEFPAEDFGKPLRAPRRVAYWKRAKAHLDGALDPEDRDNVEKILDLAQTLRDAEDSDSTDKLAHEALKVLQTIIRGSEEGKTERHD